MSLPEDLKEEIAARFRASLLRDKEAGQIKSLADYVAAESPEAQEVIAAEFLFLRGLVVQAAPDWITKYELKEQLGRGGQATVYRALDRALNRPVAFKVLDALATLNLSLFERFCREALIASRLDHPGICKVYEAGAGDNGMSRWIAMQYIDGEALSTALVDAKAGQRKSNDSSFLPLARPPSEDPTDPAAVDDEVRRVLTSTGDMPRLLTFFEDAARVLHAAHEAGVVHRDIKPGNLMVDRCGNPVILDFGIAHLEDDAFVTLTKSGDLLGTPAYMSPEQLRTHRIRIDRRTDVWALGVMLYECATLCRPFDAPTREGLYHAIQEQEPSDPRLINCKVPVDLKTVIECALQKNRDRRYQSALELAEDLRRIRCHEPIRAKSTGPLLRFYRWTQRNPKVAALLVVAAILLVCTGGLGTYLYFRMDVLRTGEAVRLLAVREKGIEAGFSHIVSHESRDALAAFLPLLDEHPELPEVVAGSSLAHAINRDWDAALSVLTPHADLEARFPSLLSLRVHLLHLSGRASEAAAIGIPPLPPQSSLDFFVEGVRMVALRKPGDIDNLRKAINLFSWAIFVSPRARLIHYTELACAAGLAKDRRLAEQCATALSFLWPDSADAWSWAGFSLMLCGTTDEAIRHYNRALEIDPRHFTTRHNLARALLDKHRWEAALDEMRKALLLKPNSAATHNNISYALMEIGDLNGAIAHSRKALALDSHNADAHVNLGRALRRNGDIDEAIASYRKALTLDDGHALAHNNLGNVMFDVGNNKEAVEHFMAALNRDAENAEVHNNIGLALLRSGDCEAASTHFRKAIAIAPSHSMAHSNLGGSLYESGDVHGAIKHFRKAIDAEKTNDVAHKNLLSVLRQLGDTDGARAELERGLALRPEDVVAWHDLAVLVATANRDLDEPDKLAVNAAQRAVTLSKEGNRQMLCTLAWTLRQAGRLEEAVSATRKALSLLNQEAAADPASRVELERLLARLIEEFSQANSAGAREDLRK